MFVVIIDSVQFSRSIHRANISAAVVAQLSALGSRIRSLAVFSRWVSYFFYYYFGKLLPLYYIVVVAYYSWYLLQLRVFQWKRTFDWSCELCASSSPSDKDTNRIGEPSPLGRLCGFTLLSDLCDHLCKWLRKAVSVCLYERLQHPRKENICQPSLHPYQTERQQASTSPPKSESQIREAQC